MFKKNHLFISLFFLFPSFVSAFDATYYWDVFEWGMTANGNIFSQTNHSAAICYEELGQLTYVSTSQTGMVVVLDDRPNCKRHINSIDLSSSVFMNFAPIETGRISDISAVPLGINVGKFIKRNISQEEFSSLWVNLWSPMANTYFAGESVRFRWSISRTEKQLILYLKNKTTGKKYTEAFRVDDSRKFDFIFQLPEETGEYSFVIAAGTSFSTSAPASILLIDTKKFQKQIPRASESELPPKRINIVPSVGNTTSHFALPSNTWWEMTITQGNTKIRTTWQYFSLSGALLSKGYAQYFLTGYTLSTPSSLDTSPSPTYIASGVVSIDRTRESVEYGKVMIRKYPKDIRFSFRLNTWYKVKAEYYVTLPNGDTREYVISRQYIDMDGFVKPNMLIRWSFPTPDIWVYRFELVQDNGIAYVNKPIHTQPTLSILSPALILSSGSTYEKQMLDSINSIRLSLGRNPLVSDRELSVLAYKKAEDMYKNKTTNTIGVSHTNSAWGDIRALATMLRIERSTLGENVAGSNNTDNTSLLDLQDGLEESPWHRNNIVSPMFYRVWIGYYQKNGYSYVVHVFSE